MTRSNEAATPKPEGAAPYSRPECIFNYCANVNLCKPKDRCIHGDEPSGGVDRAVADNRPDESGDDAGAVAADYRTCPKCGTKWTGEIVKCPTCKPEGDAGTTKPHLVYEARASLLDRAIKYFDPRNEEWDFDRADKFERHAINAVLDLQAAEKRITALLILLEKSR